MNDQPAKWTLRLALYTDQYTFLVLLCVAFPFVLLRTKRVSLPNQPVSSRGTRYVTPRCNGAVISRLTGTVQVCRHSLSLANISSRTGQTVQEIRPKLSIIVGPDRTRLDGVIVWTVEAGSAGLWDDSIVRADVTSRTNVTLPNMGSANVSDDVTLGTLLGRNGT